MSPPGVPFGPGAMSFGGFHDGFSKREMAAPEYEPVAAEFYGLRAFAIDTGTRSVSAEKAAMPYPENGGVYYPSRRGVLRAIFRTQWVWGPDTNTAECLRGTPTISWQNNRGQFIEHAAVWDQCDCGFWAYTTGVRQLSVSGPVALGVIQGWGRMVIGAHGFRAQKARIIALTVNPPDARTVQDDRDVAWENGEEPSTRIGICGPPDAHRTPDSLLRDVTELYPQAKIYETQEDMLEAYPLTDHSSLLPLPEPFVPEDN